MTSRDRLIYVLTGTASLHIAIAVALASVDPPDRRPVLPPVVEIEAVIPPPPKPMVVPKPEPEPEPEEELEPPKDLPPPPPTDRVEKQRVVKTLTPAVVSDEPAQPGDVGVPGGGDGPTLKMENLGSGTVAVEQGKPTKGRHGSGGTGTGSGTGSGSGSGSGTAAEVAVSVASIKKRAMPKGDYYSDPRNDYPEDARREGIEGQIKVRLTVSAKGEVTAVKLLNKLGHGLDELATSRAKKFEFEPAIDTDDHPVASIVVWTFTFELPK